MATVGYLEILLAVVCFLLLRRLISRDLFFPRKWPILGMLPYVLLHVNQIHDLCSCALEQTRGTFVLRGPWFCKMDMLVTVDPANIHHIMSSNFSNFPKGPRFKEIFDVLGDGIFNTDSESWRVQRKVARAFMTQHKFQRCLVNTTREKVENGLIPVLDQASKQGLVLDLQDVFQRFTFDATCMLVTGYDPGSLSPDFPEVSFSTAMDAAEEAIFFRHVTPEILWKLQRLLGIGHEKKLKKARAVLDDVAAKFIAMKHRDLSSGDKKDQVEIEASDLLESYLKEEEEISVGSPNRDKFLRDTILNFMIAGRDTTSSALTWFFWLLSKNPSVEAKIREELKTLTFVDGKRKLIGEEKFDKFVNLHGALCEALRLYPPVPFQHKAPISPDTLPSGHRVEPGMKILIPSYAQGRMSFIWGKDWREFKPERWVTGRGGIRHEPAYKFMAFNAGPRTCLGKEVAFTQMKAIAAALLRGYDFHVVEGHPVAPSVSIILHMKNGLKVNVSRRWN